MKHLTKDNGQWTIKLMPKKNGFTLIELLVTITIVAILSVIGLTTYLGVQSKARDAQRLDDAKKLITTLEQYKSGGGKYPVVTGWVDSGGGTTWITGLDTSNFIDNKLPTDPKNSARLRYFYLSNTTGTDYCLQIPQENNSEGHPYIHPSICWDTGGGNLGTNCSATKPWELRFGPDGSNSGVCKAVDAISP